jgi:predicted GIY-YIG superfamily endonuclease
VSPPGCTYILYRFFAADERLLYIGMTRNPGRRLEKHSGDKSWWSDVARIDMEHYPTVAALRDAERQAIRAEHPTHNIRMNGASGSSLTAAEKPRATSRCGLVVGSVYAIGLDDGECPVGVVTDIDGDGVTLTLYSWLSHLFDLPDTWVPYGSIKRWVRAEKEQLVYGERASDGFFYGKIVKELWLMDPLANFQTKFTAAGPARISLLGA